MRTGKIIGKVSGQLHTSVKRSSWQINPMPIVLSVNVWEISLI